MCVCHRLYRGCENGSSGLSHSHSSIEGVRMGPDPAACPVDSAAYFRCRKCRQLLFTDHEVLQHELGEGRSAFSKHRGRKGGRGNQRGGQNTTAASRNQSTEAEGEATSVTEGERETQEVDPGKVGMAEMLELEREKEKDDEEVVLGGNSEFPVASLAGISWGHTPSLVSELPVRGEVGSELTQQKHGSLSVSSPCTSYFIEPVAWMGDSLLGHVEGKVGVVMQSWSTQCVCRVKNNYWPLATFRPIM